MQPLNFDINGMNCGGCTSSVKHAPSSLKGVRHTDVTLNPGIATVVVDRDLVSPEQVQAPIAHLGYSAKLRPAVQIQQASS